MENENYLNIPGELGGGEGLGGEARALRAPFHLPCLRVHAELLRDLSLLSSSQKENKVEISSGDICEGECVHINCGDALIHTHTHRGGTHAHKHAR